MKRPLLLVPFSYAAMTVGLGIVGALPAHADITYTCDPTIDATTAGTCAYLNGNLAGLYKSIFTNANAKIYIQQIGGGLGGSDTSEISLSYNNYVTDLTAHASSDAVDVGAIAALNSVMETSAYGGTSVTITTALAMALGFNASALGGVTATGAFCGNLSAAGCYNGVITIATPSSLAAGGQGLYWNQSGGTQAGNEYDFYSVVEHETDEVLGTSSCIDTQTNPLSDSCGSGNPSAVDLFRYSSPGHLVLNSSLSTTPGAYFSFNSGSTNGAVGAVYNTLDNGDDYADFASNCAFVQDATGCLGSDLEINKDGGAEINILDAVGFNQAVPEPGTISLFLLGLGGLALYRRRRA